DFPRGTLYNYISQLYTDFSFKDLIKLIESTSFKNALTINEESILKKNNQKYSQDFHKQAINILNRISELATLFLSYYALHENIYIYNLLKKCEQLLNNYREENNSLFISDLTYLLNKL